MKFRRIYAIGSNLEILADYIFAFIEKNLRKLLASLSIKYTSQVIELVTRDFAELNFAISFKINSAKICVPRKFLTAKIYAIKVSICSGQFSQPKNLG